MKACLTEITGRIEFAAEFKGKTAKDIREKMDEVMAARGEGLVIKHPQSKYILNGRNMDWIKVRRITFIINFNYITMCHDAGQTRVYGEFAFYKKLLFLSNLTG